MNNNEEGGGGLVTNNGSDDSDATVEERSVVRDIPPSWIRSSSKKYKWLVPATFGKPRSSDVWKHFDYFEGKNSIDDFRVGYIVRCKFGGCGRELAFNGNSTHGMLGHLQSVHGELFNNKSSGKRSMPPVAEEDENGPHPRRQLRLDQFAGGEMKHLKNREKRLLDDAVLRFIVEEGLSLNITKRPSFKQLFEKGGLEYEPPSRRALCRRLKEYYDEMQCKRRKFFAKIRFIAVAADEWSLPSQNRSFFACIAHGWNNDFERFQVTMCFEPFADVKHNATNTTDYILNAIKFCGLKRDQVVCLVTDGAAVMKKASKDGKFEWIHCLAHVVHLIVGDALKSCDAVKDLLKKLRDNARYFAQSLALRRELTRAQQSLGLSPGSLKKDCPTRWSSTLQMIEACLRNVEAVNQVYGEGGKEKGLQCVKGVEVSLLKEVVDLLNAFDEITKVASKSDETASMYIPAAVALRSTLHARMQDGSRSRIGYQLAKVSAESLEKRLFSSYSDIRENIILQRAMFLNPQYSCSSHLLADDKWKAIQLEIESEGESWWKGQQTATKQMSPNIIDSSEGFAAKTANNPLSFLTQFGSVDALSTPCTNFDSQRIQASEKIMGEMELYLSKLKAFKTSTSQEGSHSVAQFWRDNSSSLPTLFRIAQKYLAPSMGSVNVERLFSTATSLVANKQRNRLQNVTVERLLLLKDFLSRGEAYFDFESNVADNIGDDSESDTDWNEQPSIVDEMENDDQINRSAPADGAAAESAAADGAEADADDNFGFNLLENSF